MRTTLGLVVVAVLVGCGGDASVSIVGDTPEQQAEELATALCELQEECGEAHIRCTSTNGTVDCTATIEPSPFAACYAEERVEILADLQACNLTLAQQPTVEDCINLSLNAACVTQEELDKQVADFEAGREPQNTRIVPPVCVEMAAIFEACSPQ